MDHNRVNESLPKGVTSLEGLYTDFEGWVARYNSYYKRSTYFSKEISTKDIQNDKRQHIAEHFEKGSLFDDLLLRQHLRHSKTPCLNFHNENDGFVCYDHVFYRLLNKNGDRRIVYKYNRSKL